MAMPPMSHEGDMAMMQGMVHVKVIDGRFDPADVNASIDGGVHFTNDGTTNHSVTILDQALNVVVDKELAPGETLHFAPPRAGSFHVYCRLHQGMDADLHVT
jgi:plastocyanin